MNINRLIIVSDPLHGKKEGGVQLKAQALSDAARTVGLAAIIARTEQVSALLTPAAETLVFIQSNGRLNETRASLISAWLNSGAWVVEENIFALASRFRPQHPRYMMALMSPDGAIRYRLRSNAALLPSVNRYLHLPNPILAHAGPTTTKRIKSVDRTLLRIGRPDPIKWTNFEVDYANALARDAGEPVRLILVGSPEGIGRRALSPKLQIETLPYGTPLRPLYESSSAYIHHSRIGESFGNTIVEAKLAGLPIIQGVDLGWDQAQLQRGVADDIISGTPSALIRSASSTYREAISIQLKGQNTALSPAEFVSRLIEGPLGKEVVDVPRMRQVVGHFRLQRSLLGKHHGYFDVPRAIGYEAARAIKNRRAMDA